MDTLASDFMSCCTAYESASKQIIARAKSKGAAEGDGGEDYGDLPPGYLDIATRSSVLLDSSLFEDKR
jgi:hypothetical protein